MLHPTIDKLRRLRLIGMAKAPGRAARPARQRAAVVRRAARHPGRPRGGRPAERRARPAPAPRPTAPGGVPGGSRLPDGPGPRSRPDPDAVERAMAPAAQQYPDPRGRPASARWDRLRPRQPGRPRRLFGAVPAAAAAARRARDGAGRGKYARLLARIARSGCSFSMTRRRRSSPSSNGAT